MISPIPNDIIVMQRSLYMLCRHICNKKTNLSVIKIEVLAMKHIQGFDRNQEILFPPKIDDYIEEDNICLLYTSDAADEEDSVDLGGRRIIKKKKKKNNNNK